MFDYTKSNYDTLVRLGKVKETDNYQVVGGLLASAHVMGAKNSDKLDKKTYAGTKARDFFIVGNSILGGDSTEFFRTYEEAGNYLPNTSTLNNEDLAKAKGFEDPNKKYPKFEYAGLSDVNKLAVGDRSHLSFQVKEYIYFLLIGHNRITVYHFFHYPGFSIIYSFLFYLIHPWLKLF
jgi:hypothetical protein